MQDSIIGPIQPISPISPISTPKPQEGKAPTQEYSFSSHVKAEAERLKKTPKLFLDNPEPVREGEEWRKPYLSPAIMSVPDDRSWLRKQGDDIAMMASGIYHIARAAVEHLPEAPEHLWGFVKDLASNPELVARRASNTFGTVLRAAVSNYDNDDGSITPESIWDGVKDHTLLAMLDALGVASLGATSMVKIAPMAGRMAELAGAVGKIPTPIIKNGTITGTRMMTQIEAGLLKTGNLINSLPARGFEAAISGAEKLPGVKGLLANYGITQDAREFFRIVGTHRLQANHEGYQAARESVKLRIPKELHGEFEDILLGAKHWDETLYDSTFNDKIREIVKTQRKYIGDARVDGLKWGSGPITEEALFTAKMKHLADRLKISVEEAKEVYQRNAVLTATKNPENWTTFRDSFRMAVEDYHLDPAKIFSDMFVVDPAFGQTMKKVGAYERFTGRAKYSKNPDVYHTNYIVANAHLQGTIKGYEAALAKYAKPWVDGAEIPAGWVEVPQPYMKYLDHQKSANGLFVKRLDEGGELHGHGTPQAYAYAWDTLREDLQPMAHEIMDIMNQGKMKMLIPQDIAKAIDIDMMPVGGFTRWYNNALNVWRKFVLDWSPRYYVNNVLGNTVLMTMGGVSPSMMKAWQYQNTPAAARRASLRLEESSLLGEIGRTRFGRAIGSITDTAAHVTDAAPRIITTNHFALEHIREKGILDSFVRKYVPNGATGEPGVVGILKTMYALEARHNDALSKILRMSAPDPGDTHTAAKLEVSALLGHRKELKLAQQELSATQAEYDLLKGKLRAIEQKLGEGLGLQDSPVVSQVPTINEHSLEPPMRGRSHTGVRDDSALTGSAPAIERIEQRMRLAAARANQLDEEIATGKQLLKEFEYRKSVHPLGGTTAVDQPGPKTNIETFGREAEAKAEKIRAALLRDTAELKQLNKDIAGFKRHGANLRKAQEIAIPKLQGELAKVEYRLEAAKTRHSAALAEGEAAVMRLGNSTPAQARAAAIDRLNGEALRDALEVSGSLNKYLKDIEPFTAAVEKAVKDMELLLGAYGRGSPMARKYMRNAIPFWTFMATMHRLVAHMPVWRPKTTALYSQMVQMAMDSFDDERLPSWAAESLPIGTTRNENGDLLTVMVRVTGMNPFESIGTRELGKLELPKLLDPTQNPLFALAAKMVGGTETYTRELPDWQRGEIIDYAGRSWRYDQNGGFEKTSRQKPLLDSFFEMIPQTQIYNDIMAHVGFKVTGDRDMFTIPGRQAKVIKSPEGETVLARPWRYGVARAFGFVPDQVDLEQAKMKEKLNTIRLARQYMRAAARDLDYDDQERAQIFKEAGYALSNLEGKKQKR